MRRLLFKLFWFWVFQLALGAGGLVLERTQSPLIQKTDATNGISTRLFAALERLARLVDITYCIGTTGVSKPFECVSRCNEFPTLSLVTTWNTGVLLSDSCGYIAVDHGSRPFDNPDSGHFFLRSDPAIVVAFRGTYSIANTIVDLSTVPQEYVPYPSPDDGGREPPKKPEHKCTNCTVHMGFLESWRQARQLVIPELARLRAMYPTRPIQLIGHSLGGAVACLAALELKVSLGWDDVVVTTFGEPRVGNNGLVRFVDEVFHLDGSNDPERLSYRRITHNNDPVPLLPLSEWGYKSHAGEIYISKQELSPSEEDVHSCIGDEDPECISGADDSFWERIHRFLRFEDISAVKDDQIGAEGIPARFKLWQLFFAHRDYFWRLGLCVPGGDPANWNKEKYKSPGLDEL